MASMASPSSSTSSSSPFPSPSLPLPRSPLFTPIPEHDIEDDDDEEEQKIHPTPNTHNQQSETSKSTAKKTPRRSDDSDRTVNCNKCRPSSREKISIVPLDTNGRRPSSTPSPTTATILKSFFSTITGKSPRPSTSSEPSDRNPAAGNDEWKLAAAELSRKLLHATRKRDEAVTESARVKRSMGELEKKLTRLESYCYDLKSALERSTTTTTTTTAVLPVEFPVNSFLRAVSVARTAVRFLGQSLAGQLTRFGPGKTLDRIALLLHPCDAKLKTSQNKKNLLLYMEAVLNRVFYEDFESSGFERTGSNRVLDPFARCKSNLASYEALKGLTWEDVLSKGTRHHDEDLSGFCDRKMSDVVAILGWARAWPEPLLQAFFGAAKGVWLVHLLAWSAHPATPIFRIDRGARFEAGYMEDVTPDRTRRWGPPGSVGMMVAPGFYVQSSVIKCKVVCMFTNDNNGVSIGRGDEHSCDHVVAPLGV